MKPPDYGFQATCLSEVEALALGHVSCPGRPDRCLSWRPETASGGGVPGLCHLHHTDHGPGRGRGGLEVSDGARSHCGCFSDLGPRTTEQELPSERTGQTESEAAS